MNPQGSKENPFGGIEWTHFFGPRTGATSNPVTGCEHECEWIMPDGKRVKCYAKDIALRLAKTAAGAAYKDGFEHISFHPKELEAVFREKTPRGIFIDSMSDLYGRNVESTWIRAVQETMEKCPQHVFFTLTKYPNRLLEFSPFPRNQFVGLSMPPTFMFGRQLTADDQFNLFRVGLEKLSQCDASVRWVSLEPLSFNPVELLAKHGTYLNWAVIGAGSDGSNYYQPDLWTLKRTVSLLDSLGVRIFFKGNLSRELAEQAGGWRQEFPNRV